MSKPEIYFHAGLGKVASTYLQKRVFPALQDICYIPRDRFRQHAKIIRRGEHERYLLSREAGKYLVDRLEAFAAIYPDAHILLFFRRHDHWIASHYRRYVKNGGTRPIREYLDVTNDQGIWKIHQACYLDLIKEVERIFGAPPFVLTYDRLQADHEDFVNKLAAHIGASVDHSLINTNPVHPSHAHNKLLALKRINRLLALKDPEQEMPARKLHRTRRRLELIRSHLLLAAAGIMPSSWYADEVLAEEEDLKAIRRYFAEDWQALLALEAAQFE